MTHLLNLRFLTLVLSFFVLFSCSDDDDDMIVNLPAEPDNPAVTGKKTTYNLNAVAVEGISGTATFIENTDNTVTIDIALSDTPASGQHPAHIHMNTAAEEGAVVLTLGVVDGDTGKSSITISALNDGTAINYEGLLAYNGYINVHLSSGDLATIVGQGDIGVNALTGESKTYDLKEKMVPGIEGNITFYERISGDALATVTLMNTPEDGSHPAHIHNNTAIEGGGIALSLNPIDGATGISNTNISKLNDGSAFNYQDALAFNGYINVHLSAEDLSTIVSQGDIGSNELTGNSMSYSLDEKDAPGISGEVVFYERISGDALATVTLMNTPEGGSHPAHIHNNSAIEGGGIALSLNPIDGTTGISNTNISKLDDGSAFDYEDALAFDGYINVHLSAEDLSTIVSQGDIGSNELTGNSMSYGLNEKDAPGISGEIVFYERISGDALATVSLMNTPEGGSHPAHIHNNSAIEGGGIALSLNPIDGTTGISNTNISKLDDGNAFDYEDALAFDGYINVHLSTENLGTIVSQGDIGSNELTGNSMSYSLTEKDAPGISGEVVFFERISGDALAMISLMNTPSGGIHPAHIHDNDVATGGGIAFSFNPVDGSSGMSYTHVAQLDNGTSFGFADIEPFMGYINVHLSPEELGTIVAQGNIGASFNDSDGEIAAIYNVTNTGSSAYVFNGGGLENESNPDFTFKRGETYEFDVKAAGHPFLIKTTETLGTGDSYNNGVTNNGAATGLIKFTVPMDAPDTLFYICEFHSAMAGTITIID